MTDEMGGGSGYSDLLLPQLDLSASDNIFIEFMKKNHKTSINQLKTGFNV